MLTIISLIILGLIAGSFINALVFRFDKPKKMLGRSQCPKCKHRLGFWDLIPVLSYIFLLGKCRYCKKPISIQYPIVELATTAIFLLLYLYSFENWYSFILLIFASIILISVFIIDLRTFYIPDYLIYTGIGLSVLLILLQYIMEGQSLYPHLIGALIGGGFFLIILLVSRGKWMGTGDIKLGLMLGILLGHPQILIALFSSFSIGGIVGLYLLAAKLKSRKDEVPLGPFLITGYFIAVIWGQQIINWYSYPYF